jgi:hypothetical protein
MCNIFEHAAAAQVMEKLLVKLIAIILEFAIEYF